MNFHRTLKPAGLGRHIWKVINRSCAAKLAFPTMAAAEAYGTQLGQAPYRCVFGEPENGCHWHLTTVKDKVRA